MTGIDLNGKQTKDLMILSREQGFPCELDDGLLAVYREQIREGRIRMYGVYQGDQLVSIGTLSLFYVFPHRDSPTGLIGHISGMFTHPCHRHKGYAGDVLGAMIADAREMRCEYVCVDSTADRLYREKGFIPAPEDESRLWLPL